MKKIILSVIFLLTLFSVLSQEKDEMLVSLDKKLNEYYTLDRENIHVHFSKSAYFTNEKIWLSGYVFTQQTGLPSIYTNNVFVEVFDSEGSFVSRNLLFSTNGVFQATLPISKNMISGTYYFRFYTNYMNNFQEDLSSVYPIEIINLNDTGYKFEKSQKYADLFIDLYPESGVFLKGIPNTIGLKVTNYLGKGIATKTGKVYDSQDNQIATFTTNNQGYGKFEISNTKNLTYRVEIENHGYTFSASLPQPTLSGVGLSVINYAYSDKTLVQFKFTDGLHDKKYYLLINQNNKIIAFPFSKENKQIVLNNEALFEGTNTARIIDENQNVLAERLFFIQPKDKTIKENKEEIAIYSFSVFAENSKVIPERNIFGSVYINPYTQENITYSSEFFIQSDRVKNFELDLFFLSQKPKEVFKSITSEDYPKEKFKFERGLAIEGKINQNIKNKKDTKIRMVSYPDLHEFTNIDENNEFVFENLIIADSTNVHFSLLNKNEKPKDLPLYPRIIGNHRKFLKSLTVPEQREAVHEIQNLNNGIDEFRMPEIKKYIVIEEIEIKGTTLKRERQNPMLKGFRAEDVIGFENMTVLDFLQLHRFVIEREMGITTVYSSRTGSSRMGRGNTIPRIFIDNQQQIENSYLETIWMNHIDEIYFDRTYIVAGMNNNFNSQVGTMGVIKIYLKSAAQRLVNSERKNTMQVTGGFTHFYDFDSSLFLGDDVGFENFGNIYWESRLNSKKGDLKFKIPNQVKKTMKVFVEGITSDGTIFSEIRSISG